MRKEKDAVSMYARTCDGASRCIQNGRSVDISDATNKQSSLLVATRHLSASMETVEIKTDGLDH
jgi:hypothetical protein